MERVLSVLLEIKTPLVVGGIAVVCFYLILRLVVESRLIPRVSRSHSFQLLVVIINRFFVIAIVALVLGFAGYGLPFLTGRLDSNVGTLAVDDVTRPQVLPGQATGDIVAALPLSRTESLVAVTIANSTQDIIIVESIDLELVGYSAAATADIPEETVSPELREGVKYQVRLSPRQREYKVTGESSYFAYGQIEKVPILLDAAEPGRYVLAVRVTWFPAGSRDQSRTEIKGRYRAVFWKAHESS